MKKDIDNFMNQAKSYLKDEQKNNPQIDIKNNFSLSLGLITPNGA
jgi:hypothetical protein